MVVLSWPIEHPTPTVPKRLPRITCRLCLLLVLATIRGAVFLVEQPSQTLMMEFPYFRWMASVFGRLVTWQVHRLLLALTGTLVQVTIVLMCICYMWLVPSGDWLSMLKQPNWVSWGAMGIHIWSQLWLLEQRLGLTYIFIFHWPLACALIAALCIWGSLLILRPFLPFQVHGPSKWRRSSRRKSERGLSATRKSEPWCANTRTVVVKAKCA